MASLKIDFNKDFQKALDLLENTSKNIFLTGKAGTGKSTLLSYFRKTTKKHIAVLAPTGVAAINIAGQTIHSFFKFRPDITVTQVKEHYNLKNKKLYQALDAIVIDEISMVRADLLDCVDAFLRINGPDKTRPFGGVQMIFIGDLYQLPPVVTGTEKELFRTFYNSPYFFDSHSFADVEFVLVELEKIYRQKDNNFIQLLNAIRNNSITEEQLFLLNQRLNPDFVKPKNTFFITLTTTNVLATEINEKELLSLPAKPRSYQAQATGKFGQDSFPTDMLLTVKVGSQVMMVNNDRDNRWVNGSIGKIVEIEKDKESGEDIFWIELSNGEVVDVLPYTWEMYAFSYNTSLQSLESQTVGTFTQYPLRLAWAVTIHKSQGKTFDNVVIDMGNGAFAHGQTYVALSRCRSFEGMILTKPISKKHIFMDHRVVKFLTQYQYQEADKHLSFEKKITLLEEAVAEDKKIEIVYLKANDTKSKRVIKPFRVGEMEYLSKRYIGVEAYCFSRKEDRVFRVDRILELKEVE